MGFYRQQEFPSHLFAHYCITHFHVSHHLELKMVVTLMNDISKLPMETCETLSEPSSESTTPAPTAGEAEPVPMTRRNLRKGLLSEEKAFEFRSANLIGKEVFGTIRKMNKKFFLHWSAKRMDAVYLHWNVLEAGLGKDESQWNGAQASCTITGLGPSCVSAYRMHPTTKVLERSAGIPSPRELVRSGCNANHWKAPQDLRVLSYVQKGRVIAFQKETPKARMKRSKMLGADGRCDRIRSWRRN